MALRGRAKKPAAGSGEAEKPTSQRSDPRVHGAADLHTSQTRTHPRYHSRLRGIAFAEQMMGLTLFPWQKWLLLHALELNEDGTYRFRYVIVLIARQNGKSLVLLILALWHSVRSG
jgi:phage terminase large subunit-like protein